MEFATLVFETAFATTSSFIATLAVIWLVGEILIGIAQAIRGAPDVVERIDDEGDE